jgi:ribonucleoside-diphosphate reductase alpha chain
LVKQGGDRQKYLCQGQSLNIFFPAGADKGYLHKVHFDAWRYGVKGLYYLRTETSNRAENVAAKVEREALKDWNQQEDDGECTACHA